MDSQETKPDAPRSGRPPGAGTSAGTQNSHRRGLPPRPPRRPPPPLHAANARLGEGRSAVRAGEVAERAGAGDTGCGKPDAPRPGRPPGAGASAGTQSGDRVVLPPRHSPPPRRSPPPHHHHHATNGCRGGGRTAVRVREVAEGAGAGDTGCGVARRLVAVGEGRKRLLSPYAQEQPKRRTMPVESRVPPDWCKEFAIPLGRNRDAGSSHRRVARADGGAGESEKAAPRPPLAGSKNDVLLGEVLPIAVGGHRGADTRVVKSSEALHRSKLAAAHGLPDTGSQAAAGYTLKNRGRGAGTGELQSKESVSSMRLPPRPRMFSAERLRRLKPSCRSNAESLLGRGSKEAQLPLEARNADGGFGVSKGAVATDAGSSAASQHVMGIVVSSSDVMGAVQDEDQVMDKRLMAQKNESNTIFGPNKEKVKASDPSLIEIVYALGGEEKLDSKVTFNLNGDDILRAAAICEGKLILYIGNSSVSPSLRRQGQHGVQNAQEVCRSKFKMICRRFEFICRVLVHAVEQHLLNPVVGGRIDLTAGRAMKMLPDFSKPSHIRGEVPGVEVGDEFLYRVQLAIVGLHRKTWAGIDWTTDIDGTPIAISIVCSGGYPDEMLRSGELIYTGSGGKPAGKKYDEDQQLEGGNLALENCIQGETPVRVIYGFESHNVEGHSNSRAKKISRYIYDGLYCVKGSCKEGEPGSMMFKYMLKKIPGQPKLPLHIAKQMLKSKMRRGLCVVDISEGDQKEGTPICVINTFDDTPPAPFKYITTIKSALRSTKVPPQGCGCTNGCSDSDCCSCARKNGGKFPFNFNGAIVSESPLIFVCGPSCKCPPSCHNRVGQQGIKIPLEVFRTSKTGWGVRSLRSISSGSFVCEYVGELWHSMEAGQRKNNGYFFNICHSKGSQPQLSGLNSSGTFSGTADDVGFRIDSTEYGNVGRFINHSCSPNLFAQSVLFDHGDKRVPHIMFIAAETIPPLQELTCEYK